MQTTHHFSDPASMREYEVTCNDSDYAAVIVDHYNGGARVIYGELPLALAAIKIDEMHDMVITTRDAGVVVNEMGGSHLETVTYLTGRSSSNVFVRYAQSMDIDDSIGQVMEIPIEGVARNEDIIAMMSSETPTDSAYFYYYDPDGKLQTLNCGKESDCSNLHEVLNKISQHV